MWVELREQRSKQQETSREIGKGHIILDEKGKRDERDELFMISHNS